MTRLKQAKPSSPPERTTRGRHEPKKPRDEMPDESSLMVLAEFFGIFGDVTRLKLISLLARADLCVQEIAAHLDMNQSAISHQLRVLKQARLVRYRRDGRLIFYSLDDDHVKQVFSQGLNHVREMREGA
ncbi:MAG: helix-turn-helix transcriptional regulator [Spirochaetes bacterium]|nr:helix-turn-helix transcriptional regulator [Spirochaetota bacterium]